MSNFDVVKKLIGNISPVGKTEVDEIRLKNLKEMCTLVELLVLEIDEVAYKNKDSYEYSVKEIQREANKFLKERLPELISE